MHERGGGRREGGNSPFQLSSPVNIDTHSSPPWANELLIALAPHPIPCTGQTGRVYES